MTNSKLIFWAVVDAAGVAAYVTLVALFMSNGERIFGGDENFIVPIVLLLLFIISALVTGSLVLGRPIYLFLGGLKREAVKLLVYTFICLAIIVLSIVTFKLINPTETLELGKTATVQKL